MLMSDAFWSAFFAALPATIFALSSFILNLLNRGKINHLQNSADANMAVTAAAAANQESIPEEATCMSATAKALAKVKGSPEQIAATAMGVARTEVAVARHRRDGELSPRPRGG